MLKIGLVGKPNAGKSTIYSALTRNTVEIANYPFTTTKANLGIALIPTECPEKIIKKRCNPREGTCINGTRYVPLEIIDVPGLIEGSSEGKGMGNEFLDNIRDADALVQIFDLSDFPVNHDGKTHGYDEFMQIQIEMVKWLSSKISREWERFAKKADASGDRMERSLLKKIGSMGLNEKQIAVILSKNSYPAKLTLWGEEDFEQLSKDMLFVSKSLVPLGNKADLIDEKTAYKIRSVVDNCAMVSGDYELAMQKAFSHGMISSLDSDFEISPEIPEKLKVALEKMRSFFSEKWVSRINDFLGSVVTDKLKHIVVFPVYDEGQWTDKAGNILPDAFLVPEGSTALDLAFRIHTDIGNGFIRAIDAKTRRVVGKDHVLSDGDIIRIVAKTP
ncbi:MAG: YchF-related putative GTPase [Thermoplasmataceae archaeon]